MSYTTNCSSTRVRVKGLEALTSHAFWEQKEQLHRQLQRGEDVSKAASMVWTAVRTVARRGDLPAFLLALAALDLPADNNLAAALNDKFWSLGMDAYGWNGLAYTLGRTAEDLASFLQISDDIASYLGARDGKTWQAAASEACLRRPDVCARTLTEWDTALIQLSPDAVSALAQLGTTNPTINAGVRDYARCFANYITDRLDGAPAGQAFIFASYYPEAARILADGASGAYADCAIAKELAASGDYADFIAAGISEIASRRKPQSVFSTSSSEVFQRLFATVYQEEARAIVTSGLHRFFFGNKRPPPTTATPWYGDDIMRRALAYAEQCYALLHVHKDPQAASATRGCRHMQGYQPRPDEVAQRIRKWFARGKTTPAGTA